MRLIDAKPLMTNGWHLVKTGESNVFLASMSLADVPTVDAVVMPKGKPGDYLEWDNGTGFKQIYHIHSVMICEDCMRYELANFTPVVNHPNIVRILSKEEAEKEWKERCARERAEEEPTLTACAEKMDGDGNA
jgi:hypothetical protein